MIWKIKKLFVHLHHKDITATSTKAIQDTIQVVER